MDEQNKTTDNKKLDVISLKGIKSELFFFFNEGKMNIQLNRKFANKKDGVLEVYTMDKKAWVDLNAQMLKIWDTEPA